MKKLRLSRILLGGALAVFATTNCVALTVTMVTVASSATVNYVTGDMVQTEETKSSSPNFTVSSSGQSSDKSAASASLVSSFLNGTTIKATGKISFTPGVDKLGNTDQTADAQTTVFLIFTIDAPAHYQFVSTCQSSGPVTNGVMFGSSLNDNGTSMSSGTLAARSLTTIEGYNDNDDEGVDPGSATWSFTLQLTPTNVPSRFTSAQKSSFLKSSINESKAADALMADAYDALSSLNAAGALQLLTAALDERSDSNVEFNQFADPLDSHYTVLAQAVAPPFSPLPTGSNITRLEADAYNAWLTNLSQSVGLSSAFDASINRAQGAAAAGNAYWDNAQMSAAVQFETRLAAVLDQEPALRSNVVAQFAAAGFNITVTTNDALSLQAEIATNGLPIQLRNGLTQLGADGATITNIQYELLTADAGTMAGGFPQTLIDTNLDAAQYATASSLRDAALTLINAAVLPTGQLRFDLPTESGYTYTIQFNDDLSKPAGWTTVFTNHATSALLSFTNKPMAGERAGFFRASHN